MVKLNHRQNYHLQTSPKKMEELNQKNEFSPAEWKSRIQEHEAKLSKEMSHYREASTKQGSEFLRNINGSYKNELNELMSSMEESHRQSREATRTVLNQLYTDYDRHKKESETLITELNDKLALSSTDVSTRTKELRDQLAGTKEESSTKDQKIDSLGQDLLEKDAQISKLYQNVARLQTVLASELKKSNDLEQNLAKARASLGKSMGEHIQEFSKLEQKLTQAEEDLQIANEQASQEIQKSAQFEKNLIKTKASLNTMSTQYSQETEKCKKYQQKLSQTEESLEILKKQNLQEIQKSTQLEQILTKTQKCLANSKSEHSAEINNSKKLSQKLAQTENLLEISKTKHCEEIQKSKQLELNLSKTSHSLANSKSEHSDEVSRANKLQQKLIKTENCLEISKTKHSEEIQKRKKLEQILAKTENILQVSKESHSKEVLKSKQLSSKLGKTEESLENLKTKHSEQVQKGKVLQQKLYSVEKELKDTMKDLKEAEKENKDLDEQIESLESEVNNLEGKLEKKKIALTEATTLIEQLKSSQKQRQGPTVNFFKDLRIVNSPPFVCDETFKNIIYLNVSESIELESIGFLGPVDCDSQYNVMIQVNQMVPKGNKWKCIGEVMKQVSARRQQVFHVDFDEPILLEDYATDEQNSFSNSHGFYNIVFSLKGPNIQSADILNGEESVEICEEVDDVMFYTKFYHNQWAEIGFNKFE